MQKVAKQELVFTWVQEHCGIWPPYNTSSNVYGDFYYLLSYLMA